MPVARFMFSNKHADATLQESGCNNRSDVSCHNKDFLPDRKPNAVEPVDGEVVDECVTTGELQ